MPSRYSVWLLAFAAVAAASVLSDGVVQSYFDITTPDGGLFGHSVAPIGDLDGDGIGELAVGAKYDHDGGTKRGAVYILFLNASGMVRAQQKISSTQGGLAQLDQNESYFGTSVAAVGDLDGDSLVDLAVGAPYDDDGGDNSGAVYILFLKANGTVHTQQKISRVHGGGLTGIGNSDLFGSSVAAIGDLDGDNVTELAVGATRDDGTNCNNCGAVYILFLHANGTLRAQQKIGHSQGGLTGLSQSDCFGSSVTAIGDLDGDSIMELAVGAEEDDSGSADMNYGALYILFLDAAGSVRTQQKISNTQGGLTGLSQHDRFGSSVAPLGDLDGDGVTDICVGAKYDDDGGNRRGAVYILFLNAAGSVRVQQKLSSLSYGIENALVNLDSFGTSIALLTPGNGTHSGPPVLAIGAGMHNQNSEGKLMMMTLKPLVRVPDGTVRWQSYLSALPAMPSNGLFGRSIAAIGDVDGDGVEGMHPAARIPPILTSPHVLLPSPVSRSARPTHARRTLWLRYVLNLASRFGQIWPWAQKEIAKTVPVALCTFSSSTPAAECAITRRSAARKAASLR